MTRDDIERMAQESGMAEVLSNYDGEYGHDNSKETAGFLELVRFAALVTAEKDKEIKRLQDLLYTQLGELTALRAEKQMRGHIKEQQEQPR